MNIFAILMAESREGLMILYTSLEKFEKPDIILEPEGITAKRYLESIRVEMAFRGEDTSTEKEPLLYEAFKERMDIANQHGTLTPAVHYLSIPTTAKPYGIFDIDTNDYHILNKEKEEFPLWKFLFLVHWFSYFPKR